MRLHELPADTQLLIFAAAADPVGRHSPVCWPGRRRRRALTEWVASGVVGLVTDPNVVLTSLQFLTYAGDNHRCLGTLGDVHAQVPSTWSSSPIDRSATQWRVMTDAGAGNAVVPDRRDLDARPTWLGQAQPADALLNPRGN